MLLSAAVMNAEVVEGVWCTRFENPMEDYQWEYESSKKHIDEYQRQMDGVDPSSKEYMELKSKVIKEEADMNIALEKINYLNSKERWVFRMKGRNDSVVAYVNPNTSIDNFIMVYDNAKKLALLVGFWANHRVSDIADEPFFEVERNLKVEPIFFETKYPLCVVTVKTPNEEKDIQFYDTGKNVCENNNITKGRGTTYYDFSGHKSDTPFEEQLNIAVISGVGTKLLQF